MEATSRNDSGNDQRLRAGDADSVHWADRRRGTYVAKVSRASSSAAGRWLCAVGVVDKMITFDSGLAVRYGLSGEGRAAS